MILALLLGLSAAPSSFVIEPPACPPAWFDAPVLERMLLADTSSVGRVFVAVVIPECERAPREVQVAVLQARLAPRQASVSLDDVPDALALRTLALAIADLMQEVTITPPEPPAAPVTPAAEKVEAPPPEDARTWSAAIDLAFVGAIHPGRSTTPAGARVGAVFGFFEEGALAVSLGVSAVTVARTVERGDVTLTELTADAGAGVRFRAGPFHVTAGALAESGLVIVAAEPHGEAQSRSARPLVRVAVSIAAAYAVGDRLSFFAEVRPGGTLHGVDVASGGERLLGVSGAFVAAHLGARLVLD